MAMTLALKSVDEKSNDTAKTHSEKYTEMQTNYNIVKSTRTICFLWTRFSCGGFAPSPMVFEIWSCLGIAYFFEMGEKKLKVVPKPHAPLHDYIFRGKDIEKPMVTLSLANQDEHERGPKEGSDQCLHVCRR